MKENEERAAEFQAKYERFVNACDAAEAEGRWNREEYGDMEGYCFGALMGILLSLINADGNIGEGEAEFLNRSFGFSYTVDDLLALYGDLGREIEGGSAENAAAAMDLLRQSGEDVAEAFRDLALLACDIAGESEDGMLESELEMIRQLRESVLK